MASTVSWLAMTKTRAGLRQIVLTLLPALALGCAGTMPSHSARAPEAAPRISRSLLQQRDLPDIPGWETRLYLIEYGPGVVAPRHHHPREGVGYVLSGSFESAFEGEAPLVVHEGQSFTDRALVSHTLFRNLDATKPLRFVIAYTIRKGEPLVEAP
jgi:quercetin dioxygenase-like cupin family protein